MNIERKMFFGISDRKIILNIDSIPGGSFRGRVVNGGREEGVDNKSFLVWRGHPLHDEEAIKRDLTT